MHDMNIAPVGYMHYLSIEIYNTQVCYCCWFEMHQLNSFKYFLVLSKLCRSRPACL